MPNYRIIGYYDDNAQVYDGDMDGEDEVDAVSALRAAQSAAERDNLVIVAILDESGKNVYEGDKASFISDWPACEEDDDA
jgi:hypothetical protein